MFEYLIVGMFLFTVIAYEFVYTFQMISIQMTGIVQPYADVFGKNETSSDCDNLCMGKIEKLNAKGNEFIKWIVDNVRSAGLYEIFKPRYLFEI